MKPSSSFTKVYLHRDRVDFRKWIDGLAAIVRTEMRLNPYESYLFGFTNRRRDTIKVLYWDRTGFAIWYKRLEEHRLDDIAARRGRVEPGHLGRSYLSDVLQRLRPQPRIAWKVRRPPAACRLSVAKGWQDPVGCLLSE